MVNNNNIILVCPILIEKTVRLEKLVLFTLLGSVAGALNSIKGRLTREGKNNLTTYMWQFHNTVRLQEAARGLRCMCHFRLNKGKAVLGFSGKLWEGEERKRRV